MSATIANAASSTLNESDSSNTLDSNSADENLCVVCFRNVTIYSIGECDHPVCYNCSTRLRVLCQQNECPICRHILAKVIFTYDKLPYRDLEAKNRSEYYSKKYKIGFYNKQIQQAFFNLLDHPCPKCDVLPFRNFQALKGHVRKEHDLHYCDICTDHLKIFTFERRCYTQAELGLHRTKGDTDNKSHRGHPLCEYCKQRFLDRDELFRHLRREHYYCHFCDADGCNEFYRDYDALADHFRQDHFLCEEGKCATEQFVGAFRTEIDYKVHISTVHGRTLNKQQAKQTRTLQLEITLGPRGCSGQIEQSIANVRRGNSDEAVEDTLEVPSVYVPHNPRSINIDPGNEQDFPSLAGATNGPNLALIKPIPPSMRNRFTASGLARTRENFPALSGNDDGQRSQNQSVAPIASMIRKPPNASTGAVARTPAPVNNGSGPGMVIHVSNRPKSSTQNGAASGKKNAFDFPALPKGKSKKQAAMDEDMLPSTSYIPLTNVSAKHRTLVDDYVSVANPSTFHKLQLIEKEQLEAQARKIAEQKSAPKLTSQDFPSLSGKPAAPVSNWGKTVSEKKQREIENRKAKVAPAPLLPPNKENKTKQQTMSIKTPTTNNNTLPQNNHDSSTKKEKKIKEKKEKIAPEPNMQQNKTNAKSKEKNNNENKSTNSNSNSNNITGTLRPHTPLTNDNDSSSAPTVRPPPGFVGQSAAVKPPPGFQSNVTINSVAKSPNNLTFTSSLGESYNIVSAHAYISPPECTSRNQRLVGLFKETLKSPAALEEFRKYSQAFREGNVNPHDYYERCQTVLKGKFDKAFPEFLALLPDISKQQVLFLVHAQQLNEMSPKRRESLRELEVCSVCKQVLVYRDVMNHEEMHKLKDNFPSLSTGVAAVAKNFFTDRK